MIATVEDLRKRTWVQPVNLWQGAEKSIHSDAGRVVCVSVADKTEFARVDAELTDTQGWMVAQMRRLMRWTKASWLLWKA